MKRIIIERFKLGEVPVLLMCEEGGGNLPVVAFLHGFTSDKSQGINLGYALAEEKMAMIALAPRPRRGPTSLEKSIQSV
ncbi:MAG: hypothetical protein QMD53_05035 [Actinomycetota bacterium]|nr:hypothetical protein [Actinomycetota bacterium]